MGKIQYISTRGEMPPRAFTDILLGGLAPDGGLIVPDAYPRIGSDLLSAWRKLDYASLAYALLSRFIPDIPPVDLQRLTRAAYNKETFGTEEITPLVELEKELYLLRLSNGPTLAFKDVAMQLLGRLFEYVLEQRGQNLNILGATSGDTGSSAEHAMLGIDRVRVFMLSPLNGMSPFQQAQMYALDAPNIFNIAVDGVFDDCQDLVKAVSADPGFKARHNIGAVNSINWARIAAQVVYYFKAWLALDPAPDELVSFAVPSGNFGNVCAGHVAKQMGLPIHRLIVATNENDVLDEFFRTGLYSPRAATAVHQTSSPSMDISKASNFERFVFDVLGRDPQRLSSFWKQLAEGGCVDLRDPEYRHRVEQFGFVSGASSHAERIRIIRHASSAWNRLVDPHTADGIKVALENKLDGERMVCLETALATKFEVTINEALGTVPPRPEGFQALESLPQHRDVLNPDLEVIKSYIATRAN